MEMDQEHSEQAWDIFNVLTQAFQREMDENQAAKPWVGINWGEIGQFKKKNSKIHMPGGLPGGYV